MGACVCIVGKVVKRLTTVQRSNIRILSKWRAQLPQVTQSKKTEKQSHNRNYAAGFFTSNQSRSYPLCPRLFRRRMSPRRVRRPRPFLDIRQPSDTPTAWRSGRPPGRPRAPLPTPSIKGRPPLKFARPSACTTRHMSSACAVRQRLSTLPDCSRWRAFISPVFWISKLKFLTSLPYFGAYFV
jgi:hypothetical protein